jgi:CheY-like chemotaxis protein
VLTALVHISVSKPLPTVSRRKRNQEEMSMTGRAAGMSRAPRILVVEDEESLAAVIADVLGDSHDVVCAANVGDAIDHLLGDDIDLVLLDCVAPGRTELAGRSRS